MTAKPYHHGDLHNALLCACEELVTEKGVMGVTLREVARRAGVSHSAPAHHFRDKTGLLEGFAEQGFRMLTDAMVAAYAASQDRPMLDHIRGMGAAYLQFAISHPSHYDVMFRMQPSEANTSPLKEVRDAAFFPLALTVGRLVEHGVVPADNSRYFATILWSVMHGFTSLWLDGILPGFYEDHTFDEAADGLLDSMNQLLRPSFPKS